MISQNYSNRCEDILTRFFTTKIHITELEGNFYFIQCQAKKYRVKRRTHRKENRILPGENLFWNLCLAFSFELKYVLNLNILKLQITCLR